MRRARLIAVSVVLLALVAAVAAVASGGDGDDGGYRLRLPLENAAGLRDGSQVVSGGVPVGTVALKLGRDDRVEAELRLERRAAPVAKDVQVAIAAVNLLGQKRVELLRGDGGDPAPSGYVVPARNIAVSTDLDQVLATLDDDTRTRLSVLINEAGAALGGRREAFSQVIGELPGSLVSAKRLLGELVGDNRVLADLVTRSDRVVGALAGERQALSRVVDVAGRAAESVEQRRAGLQRSLAAAPATLDQLRRFLAELRATTGPLGPAARDITAVAPDLQATLDRVEGFRRSADPALRRAREVAPDLTRLGDRATPVLTRAMPTLKSLATVSAALTPVSDTLLHSANNLVATVENWARAIQFRDGLSHVFRGEASVTLNTLTSVLDRFGALAAKQTGGSTAVPLDQELPADERARGRDRRGARADDRATALRAATRGLEALLGP
ncbi:MlaD family protein [Patulibacter defluvii]|uniref:MlaD family protein n=1 Tax=Patulibacter defluvii TaxID=3095358 RepID=UPI002A759331|nr:MlaD family protein [Patulibacter sp. DM4]